MRWTWALGWAVAAVPPMAQAQERITTVPPQPPVLATPAPAPIATLRTEPVRESLVTVRVFGGEERLWDRELRLRGYSGAQVDLKLTQAPQVCGTEFSDRYAQNARTGLELRVGPRGSNDNTFAVVAEWVRAGTDCTQPGTLMVGLDVTVDLPPGQTRVLRGDGGLRIELTRAR